jgi:hypothetical protein
MVTGTLSSLGNVWFEKNNRPRHYSYELLHLYIKRLEIISSNMLS